MPVFSLHLDVALFRKAGARESEAHAQSGGVRKLGARIELSLIPETFAITWKMLTFARI